jgi:hypothetical protein
MAFADVIRKQRSGGKGVFGSLSSAATESLKEKMDPRNLLDQKGVLTALFPGLKSYKTKQVERSSRRIATGPSLVSVNNDTLNAMNEKLDFIGKNTMSLPIMMRDINVMRQSMIKLVKLQGGEQKDSADKFFKTSAEQEKLYENTLKSKKGSTAPTKVGGEVKTSSMGNLALMATVFLGVLGAYFTSSEFKEKVDNLIGGLVKSVFGETTFSDLVTGVTAAIGALAVLKLTFMAFDTFMKGMMTRLGTKIFGPGAPVPTPGDVPDVDKDKAKGKGKSKYGTIQDRPKGNLDKAKELASKARGAMNATNFARMGALGLLVGEAYMLYKLIESDSHETPSQADVEEGVDGGWTPEQGFTADGGPVDTDKIKGLPNVPNYVDPSGAKAEQNRLSNYKPSRVSNNELLEMIGKAEGGAMGYDAINKGKAGDTPEGLPGLSNMTVGQVMQLQKDKKVFAAGKYQIIPTTLKGLVDSGIVKIEDKFDSATQDKLANELIQRRLNRAGSDPIQQQLELSKEFASIANPHTGSSYYDGKGNNKASIASIFTRTPGSTIAASSVAVADGKMASSMPPVVINSPQTVNNMAQSGSSNIITASVLDEEFARLLFERAVI